MGDENKGAVTDNPVQAPVDSVDDIKKQLEQTKALQAGSDRAYQETAKKAKELEKELEAIKKEKMSEKEKADYEYSRQKAELEIKSREVAEATLRFSKIKILGEKNIPLDFAEYIGGANDDEIKSNVDTFMKRFNSAVQKGVEEKLMQTPKPKAGSEPAGSNGKLDVSKLSFKELERLAREGKL